MELLYQYKEYLSNYSSKTKEVYYTNVKLYLEYLKEIKGKVNIIQVCNVTRGDIYNYIAYMDNLSKNTKDIRLNSIKNFYSYLNKNIADFLFKDIKLYNLNKKIPVCLSWQQCDRLINYYSDKRNKLIIYLFLSTGMRLSECAEITIQNINLEEKYITCRCKGNKTRNILINEKCKNMIQNYIGDRTEGKLFNIQKRDIQYIVKKALKELGFKGSTHTLRHSAATIIYQKTKDILLVKEFLGHSSVISSQIYAHMNNEMVKEAVEKNPLANYEVGGRK